MAAIKHIRSAEMKAVDVENELSYAGAEAHKEGQHLLACLIRDLRQEFAAVRDRLVRMKKAQEANEAADPRINPNAGAERVEVKMSLPGKVGMTFMNVTASIPAEGDESKEIQARLMALIDRAGDGLASHVVSVGIVTPKKPSA